MAGRLISLAYRGAESFQNTRDATAEARDVIT
jgi:hypothetical protein